MKVQNSVFLVTGGARAVMADVRVEAGEKLAKELGPNARSAQTSADTAATRYPARATDTSPAPTAPGLTKGFGIPADILISQHQEDVETA